MTSYSRGDVILVDIAFSGASGSKRRPAVVISTSNFNSAGIKLIVAAVTGNVSPPFRPGDTCGGRPLSRAGNPCPNSPLGLTPQALCYHLLRRLVALNSANFRDRTLASGYKNDPPIHDSHRHFHLLDLLRIDFENVLRQNHQVGELARRDCSFFIFLKLCKG